MSVDVAISKKISKILTGNSGRKPLGLLMKKSPNPQKNLIEENQRTVGRKNLLSNI